MKTKEFVQLFVPPIYYKVKKRLFPKTGPERHPMLSLSAWTIKANSICINASSN